ncbi:MAG TPA: PAS domain S-box protein, partial [Polyangiaceae bacterium]|nr:PAS domain S-box protein [Polyangiaceae bacterium]
VTSAAGRIVMVNREMERLTGYSRQALLAMSVEALVPERLRASHREFRASFVNDPSIFKPGEVHDLVCLRRDGSEANLEVGITTIMTGDGLYIVSSVVEVSARRRADARFRVLVESSPNGMLMIDAEGRIALVNREIERIFGYERDALLGRPAELLLPELLRGVCGALCASAGQRPTDPSFGARRELVGLRRDGSELPLEVGLSPIETDDGPCILASLVDISARREHERERAELELQLRQAQRLESLGRLAGGIAHDFNNILAAILSLTELAAVTSEGRPAPELEDIVLATNRGRDLVQRILLFSKGRGVASEPTELSTSVPEAVQAIRASLPHGVEVDVRIDAPGLVVLADETAIHQIVANLVGNAANAMPRGGRIEVRVDRYAERASLLRVQPKLEDGSYARIRVVDAGIGMDSATREHAFEPFFTTRGPREGTGLGLAIVHGLTHELGGTVWLESQLGKGTTVTCLLPTTHGVARGRADHGPSSAMRAPSGKRVLFVEDEPILAAATGLLLKKAGYETVVHTDALAALSAFAASRGDWDIIVTDYAMPKVSGLDLAAQLHRLRADVPIVLLTGQMDSFPVPELEESGVISVVPKPASISRLVAAIEDASARSARRSSRSAPPLAYGAR